MFQGSKIIPQNKNPEMNNGNSFIFSYLKFSIFIVICVLQAKIDK